MDILSWVLSLFLGVLLELIFFPMLYIFLLHIYCSTDDLETLS
jgi:hypothetical protein